MDTVQALGCSVVAEVAFVTRDGAVDAAVVHPLRHDGEVLLALPFAQRALADSLGAARSVALVSSDARLVLRGWQPVAAVGQVDVRADLDGRWFAEELLEEELRRHPPSRLLADSIMQRHEHWWYLPRLLCRVRRPLWEGPVAAREDPRTTGVLAWDAAEGLRTATVEVREPHRDRVAVHGLSGHAVSGASDPACLLMHDFSVPDLEQRCALVLQGRLEGDRLTVERRRGRLELPPPPGLLRRWKALRTLSRDCRREIARARRDEVAADGPGA